MLRWSGAGAHDAQGKAEGAALVESCKEKAKEGLRSLYIAHSRMWRRQRQIILGARY